MTTYYGKFTTRDCNETNCYSIALQGDKDTLATAAFIMREGIELGDVEDVHAQVLAAPPLAPADQETDYVDKTTDICSLEDGEFAHIQTAYFYGVVAADQQTAHQAWSRVYANNAVIAQPWNTQTAQQTHGLAVARMVLDSMDIATMEQTLLEYLIKEFDEMSVDEFIEFAKEREYVIED